MKKIISLILVVVMLFSFSLTAFAATTDEVSAKALEAAQASFENNGLTQAQIEASTVTSCEVLASGIFYTTYSVTVQSGLIYYYSCTVSVGNFTGVMIVDNGLFATSESTGLTFLNIIFEWVTSFITQIQNFLFGGLFA